MGIKVYMIFSLIIIIFISANYYIGINGWSLFKELFPKLKKKVYWPIFWTIALSFIIGMVSTKLYKIKFLSIFMYIGFYWIAAMMYFLIFIFIIEILKRILYKSKKFQDLKKYKSAFGVFIISLVSCLLIYGTFNARIPVVKKYNVTIDKKSSNLIKLNIVMISDVHLGTIIDKNQLESYVSKINNLNPDIIFIAGDLIDGNLAPVVDNNMGETLTKLKSKYGTHAILGNHEFIGGDTSETIDYIRSSGVNLLIDSYTKIDNSFYVVGRNDLSANMFENNPRKELSDVLDGIDKSLPIILLDHQPKSFDEAISSKIDLQLSGHTHKGQMFPGSLITRNIHELDWGYGKKGNFNVIVSSGLGTWGPPVRIGTDSEIVFVELSFR